MDLNRFWVLAAKKLSGDATREELLELEHFVQDHPEAEDLLADAKTAWDNSPEPFREDFSQSYLLQKLRQITERGHNVHDGGRSRFFSRKKITLLLSSLVILAVAAFLVFEWSGNRAQVKGIKSEDHTVSAQKGSRKTKIVLPDGSTVLLNADSRIFYSEDFARERKLRLEGEAFFEVVRNDKNPFIIHTSDMDIRVLGTTFNVKSYPEEGISEASLLKGSIEVRVRNRPEQAIILKPNEKISVAAAPVNEEKEKPRATKKQEPLIAINKIELDQRENIIREIAWTQDKLYFHAERLDHVAMMLERWFGKRVIVEDDQLKMMRYTGNFENESLQEVLEALRLSAPFQYRVDKELVMIYKNN